MLLLLHYIFGWINRYPMGAVIIDTIILTLAILVGIIYLLAKWKGLRWTIG